MASQRELNIATLIDDCIMKLGNQVKWPESEGVQKEVDLALKALRKLFREDSYPDSFRYLTISYIASSLLHDTINRNVKFGNFKPAWLKLTEMFE